jgi:hypothetical protein
MAAHSFSSPPGLTVTGARWKGLELLLATPGSSAAPGLPGTPDPRSATGFRCPVRSAWHTGTRFRNQSAGVPVNARARTAVTYPGFTRPGEKFYCPFQC